MKDENRPSDDSDCRARCFRREPPGRLCSPKAAFPGCHLPATCSAPTPGSRYTCPSPQSRTATVGARPGAPCRHHPGSETRPPCLQRAPTSEHSRDRAGQRPQPVLTPGGCRMASSHRTSHSRGDACLGACQGAGAARDGGPRTPPRPGTEATGAGLLSIKALELRVGGCLARPGRREGRPWLPWTLARAAAGSQLPGQGPVHTLRAPSVPSSAKPL